MNPEEKAKAVMRKLTKESWNECYKLNRVTQTMKEDYEDELKDRKEGYCGDMCKKHKSHYDKRTNQLKKAIEVLK